MDSKAAGEYLDLLFGTASGYVALAFKGPRNSWTEEQFEWPNDRRKILWWAKEHSHGDVFICPALRADAHTRKKTDGVNLRWLWADVDMDKVPSDKRGLVVKRMEQLGTLIVSSGSGLNAHVYVKLAGGPVDVEEHWRLNTGLRDYLYADAKHADNSLLRLPGTANQKPGAGGVVMRGGHRKAIRPDALKRLRAFARVTGGMGGGDVSWTRVDVSDVSPRFKRLARMPVDEATGRYGSRYKAEWAVVGEMHKAGLDADQIHTLMDQFPAALDKAAEEHGAHDVHKTVAKRLRAIEEANRVVETGGDDESPFQDLSDDEIRQMRDEHPDNPLVAKILARREAERQVAQIEAMRRFMAPPPDVSWCAADGLANPPEEQKYLIDGLAGIKHNVVITAQYKTGKTALVLGSLAKSLCDGTAFLGHFRVPTVGMVVGHWNCEMEGFELLDDYIRPAGFENPHNLHVANLRGYGVNILTEIGKAWAVEWLRSRNVQVWTIDSLARLLRMCGVKEQDNHEVLNVLMALDEIKVEAGVDVSFVIAHTGRAEHDEGKERARGATVIDDWPDARWVLTRTGDIRFLAVEGRGVRLPTTSLNFNHETKVSTLGVEGKDNAMADGYTQTIVQIVKDNAGVARTTLVTMVKRALKVGNESARDAIEDAIAGGWIEARRVARSSGGRAQIKHYVVDLEDGGKDGVSASKRAVDFRKVGTRPGRR